MHSFLRAIGFSNVKSRLDFQKILGIIGVPKYSPIKASICFLINGVKFRVVGVLTP